MTQLFGQAIAKVSELTSAEQNAIATMILDELADEEKWKHYFAQSQDQLAKLAIPCGCPISNVLRII
jgi:hypothetical protein